VSNIPPEPEAKCRCILPVQVRGTDYSTCFGVTRCNNCGKFVRWGVGPHSLLGPSR
jgi:hypothetical protein